MQQRRYLAPSIREDFHGTHGLDKPAALYIYPYEDHGPAGKETQLDMWARWIAWLDYYVKNAGEKTEEQK
jgi:hypothetical protein